LNLEIGGVSVGLFALSVNLLGGIAPHRLQWLASRASAVAGPDQQSVAGNRRGATHMAARRDWNLIGPTIPYRYAPGVPKEQVF
jgi:hypothetical protein